MIFLLTVFLILVSIIANTSWYKTFEEKIYGKAAEEDRE
jgi:hypothetical protein